MHIAAVCVPHFPSLAESSRRPYLRNRPVLITDSDQPKLIIDCSAAAEAHGVHVGMAFRKAVSRSPDATVVTADPHWYAESWGTILDALEHISPQVEDAELGRAFLNIDGLAPHYRDDLDLGETIIDATRRSLSLSASVGLGNGKFPALAAAIVSAADEITAIPPGLEREFLSPLHVSLLPGGDEVHDRLTRLWGLHSIGEVAALPRGGLLNQLGKVGERLWLLANGIDNEPLLARQHHRVVEDVLSFDGVVGTIDVLLVAGQQMISRLHELLNGRAAREMVIQAELETGRSWERRVTLRDAINERDRLTFIFKSSLAQQPPNGLVENLTIRLSGLTGGAGRQMGLGDTVRSRDALAESIRQLRHQYGRSPIKRIVEVEPWSPVPEERQALVEFNG